MHRRWICFIWGVIAALSVTVTAQASRQMGSLQIIPQWGGKTVYGGSMTICRVGTKVDNGFQLTDGLANWVIAQEDLEKEDWAGWIAQHSGRQQPGDPAPDGSVWFRNLQEGVYLVCQKEPADQFREVKPFLIAVPQEEAWNICRTVKMIYEGESPHTGDHPAPILGAMGIGLSAAVLMVLGDKHRK